MLNLLAGQKRECAITILHGILQIILWIITPGSERCWPFATLDHLFGQLNSGVRIKRGSLFTLDDAKNNNLIFVGSPAENLTLREIPSTHEFIFQRVDSGPRKGDLAIFNVHPRPDEASTFLPNPPRPPLSEDYAIIALVRGLNPTRSTLILGGNFDPRYTSRC